jgi:lipopolysaccharide biosynthesis glycosyltransferase
MKLKIITAYDDGYKDVGDLSAKSIALYAFANNFEFEIFNVNTFDRPPAWIKIYLLIQEIKSNKYDYILWVDADACFIRVDKNILDEVRPDKDIYLVNHLCTIGRLDGCPGLSLQCERPNTGVMLVKASNWSTQFLETIWQQEEFINHGWWEQAALHKLIGYHYEISNGATKNEPVESILSHIHWLNNRWNCVPTAMDPTTDEPIVKNQLDPIIIHYAGMKNELRLNEMNKLKLEILLKNKSSRGVE